MIPRQAISSDRHRHAANLQSDQAESEMEIARVKLAQEDGMMLLKPPNDYVTFLRALTTGVKGKEITRRQCPFLTPD